MNSDLTAKNPDEDAVEAERSAIARMSKLNAVHWLAVLLSLLLTTGAWYITSLQVASQAENRFTRYSNQVLELVQERMTRYEDALASGVAAIQSAGGEISYEEWRAFTEALQIETKYPGINGIGIIYRIPRAEVGEFLAKQRQTRPEFRVYPEHEGETLYPITYIEPEGENSVALGLDMAHETNRLNATLKARDSGKPQITGPIVLVQDAQKTPGFLFHMPFYAGQQAATIEERRANFVGTVYAPFLFHKLIEGVLGKDSRLVQFSIRDDDEVLYDENDRNSSEFEPQYRLTRDVEFYGRTWTFDIWETPEFRFTSRSNEPIMILVGGLVIDALLFSLFVLLTRSNRRALVFADQMNVKARNRAESLQRSNEDLERFAFVASHDLKTPLRGIGFLAECIRDDLEILQDHDPESELLENLEMLEDQVRRMDNLITGILTYSSIRSDSVISETVETAQLIQSLCASAGLRPNQYTLSGDLVEIATDAIRLEQVLQNLISNARKYHPEPDKLELNINIEDRGERLHFSVSDNGPGIDPRYHGKIFEMFQTLQPSKSADSTGIGLSIVQKTVKLYDGNIQLDSQLGQGSRFTFDWPKHLSDTVEMKIAA
ncbi:CHASE domain-containing protein [uncultured Roseovarius sp.]|uniref:CHASE domain-containing protein n=1 Tax=uncultured Roseovarius sp. TaxID=293344 RepID=UPI002629FF55|nr:CHASE domain-containing protein [uncultured Roseovarius sp.]